MPENVIKDSRLHVIFGITLFAILGVSSLAPAFPVIIDAFGLDKKQVSYLITVFTLPGIFLAPFLGMLADRFGRKAILVPSMAVFGIAGVLCAFQSNYSMLLVMRFFQGVGASALGSLNVTLIGDLFDGASRKEAMGYNASVLSIGTASFPAVGGILAAIDWHYIFYLPGFIIMLIPVLIFKLDLPEINGVGKLKDYLIKVVRTINRKIVWGLFITNIIAFIILYGPYLTFFPLLLKDRLGAGPAKIGLLMSLMSLVTAIIASQYKRITELLSTVKLLYVSTLFYALSLAVFIFANNNMLVVTGVLFFGLAHGSFIPNMQTVLVGLAPVSERAAFMSVNGMVLRIGQSIGPLFAAYFYFNNSFLPVYLSGIILILVIVPVVRFMVKP